METLQVALGRRSYPIYIGGGLLEQAEELLRHWAWAAGPSSATTRWKPCTALRWPAAPAGRW